MLTPQTALIQVGPVWWQFGLPEIVIAAAAPADVLPALQTIEQAVNQQQLYAIGFLTYEAAAAFHLTVHPSPPDDLPLLWFGLYRAPHILDTLPPPPAPFAPLPWQSTIDAAAYHTAIQAIKAEIAQGNSYQVNFTFPLRTAFARDGYAFFYHLAQAQQASYTAYLDLGRWIICSASPELFFALDGERLWSKPMKGTMARGRTPAQDEQTRLALYHSEKDRAENVMIVDMIRNDMGRVCQTGSVQVPHLFATEPYPTLWQMTSTVTGHSAAPFSDILAAMFPCASITGAPKVRTMEIINQLEARPRSLYTGAIGYLAPGRQAQFNVAIRTALVDQQTQLARYHIGSGIVWDSDPQAEWQECQLKAKILGSGKEESKSFLATN